MTVRTTALQNRAAGLPAEEFRLLSSRFVPASAGGLHAFSGVLPAPAGYMGEVTLLGPTAIRINPGRWVVAGTQSGTQGDYVITNDAPVELVIGARDATLTRLDRLVVQVRDTAYTPNEGVDAPDIRIIPGTPALNGAALPAVPVNSLVLGSITVPPGSGTVTFTPTIVPLQVTAGGIQPGRIGEAARNGSYDGEFRDHPTWGLQRWNTTTGTWDDTVIDRLRFANVQDVDLTSTGHPFQIGPDTSQNLALDGNQIQSRNGSGGVAWLGINTETAGGNNGDVEIGPVYINGAEVDGGDYQYLGVPRIRITGTNDAQQRNDDNTGTPSTLHPLQIGPDSAQHVIIDQNEGMARTALTGVSSSNPNGTGGGKIVGFNWHGLEVDEPAGDLNPVRRGTLNGNSGLANHTTWQNFSLASRWTTYAGGPGAKWIYMNGTVWFSMGIVSATAWGANAAIVTWSSTWKPRYDQYFFAVTNGQPFGEVRIEASTGVMSVTTAYAGTNGPLSISGSFIPATVF